MCHCNVTVHFILFGLYCEKTKRIKKMEVLWLYKNKELDNGVLGNINWYAYHRLFFETMAFYSIVTLLLRAKGLSFTQIMLLSSIENILTTAFELPTGVVADKFGRKVSVMSGIFFFGLFIVSYMIFSSFTALVCAAVVCALSATMISGAKSAMIYDYLKYKELEDIYIDFNGKVSSKVMVVKSFVVIASTYLFGINNNLPLALSLVSCAVALMCLSKFVESPIVRGEDTDAEENKGMFGFIKSIKLNGTLRSLIAIRIVVIVVISNAFYLTELMLSDMGVEVSKIGLIMFCYTLMSALGSRSASKVSDKLGDRVFYIMFIVFGVNLILSSINNIIIVVASIGVLRFFNSAMSPIFGSVANKNIDSEERATILSVVSLFLSFGMAVTDPIIGVVADTYSLPVVYRVLGVLCIVSSMIAYRFYKKRISFKE